MGYSNEIDTLPADFRSFNGFVELAFVSSPQMQPKLRRTIANGDIGYLLNGKQIDRLEAKSFVKLFGMSHWYPFQYCIQPDDMHSVLHSDEQARWHWLMDCCGLRDYNRTKRQSVRLFRETSDELGVINSALWKIDSHLRKFDDHSAEVTMRSLEQRIADLGHVQCKRQMAELQAEIAKLDVDIAISGGSVQMWGQRAMEMGSEVGSRQVAVKEAKMRIAELEQLQKAVQQNVAQLEQRRQSLSSTVVELRTVLQCSRFIEARSVHEKQLLEQSMEDREHEMDELNGQLVRAQRSSDTHRQRIAELQEQRRAIFLRSEQNQRMQMEFMGADERDEHIASAIGETNAGIAAETRSVKRFQTELLRLIQPLQGMKEALDAKKCELQKLKADSVDEDVRQQKEACDGLVKRSR